MVYYKCTVSSPFRRCSSGWRRSDRAPCWRRGPFILSGFSTCFEQMFVIYYQKNTCSERGVACELQRFNHFSFGANERGAAENPLSLHPRNAGLSYFGLSPFLLASLQFRPVLPILFHPVAPALQPAGGEKNHLHPSSARPQILLWFRCGLKV